MELADYLQVYIGNQEDWTFTLRIENMAESLLSLLRRYGNCPDAESVNFAMEFLLEVEKWKQMCLMSRIGNAVRNSPEEIWTSLLSASTAGSDVEAFRPIMNLIGFGRSPDPKTGQRRAKQASAVLRFLDPKRWGVVDWRNAAILALYERNDYNATRTIARTREDDPDDYRDLFEIIDENAASVYQEEYRNLISPRLPRAADVDMALFGVSLEAWPLPR